MGKQGVHFAVVNGSTGSNVTQNIEGMSSVCRLFYAGACEGQMPEILTMIQIKKLTPTPAVLCMVRVVFSSAVKYHDSILSCLLLDMLCAQQVCRQFTSTLELNSNITIITHIMGCGKEINNALKFCKGEREWRSTKLSVRFDVLTAAMFYL